LATNQNRMAQLVALLFMENALALFESLLPEPWPLPVHLSISTVYVLTVWVGSWLVSAAPEPDATPEPMPEPVPTPPGANRGHWILPTLLALAVLAWLASVAVFVLVPLENMPLYLAGRYLVLDATSLLFVLVVNTVFLGIGVYMVSRERSSPELLSDLRQRARWSLLFMLVMNLGILCNHLILQWALIEVTTACAVLMMVCGQFGAPRAVAWRYMLYSSMTLALTFLGFMCLTQSAALRGLDISFHADLLGQALSPDKDPWQRLGLALMLFGLGGKLGLAPLYSWLPETYEAAPSSTSALLAAVQFNISVVALFRVLQAFQGIEVGFVSEQLLVMGYASLLVAAIQIMAARNYKRLIAYACISSSGVIALGLSVGKVAAYGVVLYIVSNAFVKSLLFITAGRMRAVYGSNDVAALAGVIRVLPFAGMLFAGGIFALLGFPPFASFLAEMLILSGIVQAGNLLAFTLMCVMLTVIFVATGRTIFPMLWGQPQQVRPPYKESLLSVVPKLGFVGLLTMLGTYTPEVFTRLMGAVARSIGGS
jgi:hydrogenase-4 component F